MTSIYLPDSVATEYYGANLAKQLPNKCLIFLTGDLGSGKTTLVRGFLRALGYNNTVKSPTYTLVEEYPLKRGLVCHFDLYRVQDPEELELIGIRDYLSQQAICFIEWPERGLNTLPEPDIHINLVQEGQGRRLFCLGLEDEKK